MECGKGGEVGGRKGFWRWVLCVGFSLVVSYGVVYAQKEILVGAVNSMTGSEAMVGKDHRWAYEEAVKDINASGGVFVKELNKRLPMRLVVVDDKSDPTAAAAAAEKLIKLHKVHFLLGTVMGPLNIPAATVAEKYKKVYVTSTFWPEDFLARKYSWVALSFFYASDVAKSGIISMKLLPPDQIPKRVCVMVPDIVDGHIFGEGAKKILAAEGLECALYEPYQMGSKDFSASILKMKERQVDAIIYFGSSTDAITLVRQMREHDFNPKYVWGARGTWPNEFYEALGNNADYICHDGHWSPAYGYGRSKELDSRYRKAFGGKTSPTIGNFYSLVEVLAQAIEAAGSLDSRKVRDVFYSGQFVAKGTTNGDLKFDKRGLATFLPICLQWYKGERMPVHPPLPQVWTLKPIPPWKERGL